MAVDLGDIAKEIIVVNDGSTDNSKEIIDRALDDHDVIVVHHSLINLGKGAAVRYGFDDGDRRHCYYPRC